MNDTKEESRNIIVIGSGVGGLTAAIMLAKMGHQVTVVEKNRDPGGMMRSYVRSGFHCPVGVHYISSMAPGEPLKRLLDYMGIYDRIPVERMGKDGLIDRYIFDRFSFDLPPGLEAFEANLRACFPNEDKQITAVVDRLKETIASIATLEGMLSPGAAPSPDSMQTSGEFFNQLGCSPEMIDVLGASTYLLGVHVEECPIWLHMTTLAAYLLSSWRLRCSGSAMAEAYADRLIELGGRIMLEQTVNTIEMTDGRVSGVTLQSGRKMAADQVVAGVHPKAVLDLLPAEAVKPNHRQRIDALDESPGIFCLQAAVSSRHQPKRSYNLYRVHQRQGKDRDLTFYQIRGGDPPEWNLLTIIKSSPYSYWQNWAGTVTGRRDSDYQAQKEREGARALEEAAKVLGPLGDTRILDTYTPLTIRDWIGAPEGAPYGVRHSLDQILTTILVSRRAVNGLFMVGQSLAAPGILGTSLGVLRTVGFMVGQKRLLRELDISY